MRFRILRTSEAEYITDCDHHPLPVKFKSIAGGSFYVTVTQLWAGTARETSQGAQLRSRLTITGNIAVAWNLMPGHFLGKLQI